MKRFEGSFTQQEPIPEAGIERAVAVLRSGRLHRYNVAPGETPEVNHLEREFADYLGVPYCLACASGGYALQTAMRAFGVRPAEPVLTNAFTLAPVPGAIAALGACPVLVEVTEQLVIDLDDLAAKARASGARLLMLSHMRGHLVDMESLMATATAHGLAVIEDCAHTMGAQWRGVKSGRHGLAACYSMQTYKHINTGEGGLITSADAELMARATMLSGSYMFYGRHDAAPEAEVFADIRLDTPNCSGRLDNLRAAIARPQLAALEDNVARWNKRYRAVEAALADASGLTVPHRPNEERYVGSSIQFLVDGLGPAGMAALVRTCQARGVELKWFGAPEPVAFTSRHDSWRYVASQSLPRTDAVLARLCDMRIPLTFEVAECALIGSIIAESLRDLRAHGAQPA